MKYWKMFIFFIFLFFSSCRWEASSNEKIAKFCSNASDQKSCIDSIDYVEGKGFCIAKYDEEGCNVCTLQEAPYWFCTMEGCLEVQTEKANKCVRYSQSFPPSFDN